MIINAALALAARPKSQVVKKTMEMYKRTWENHIHVLTEAVDDITSIDDFLAVSGPVPLLQRGAVLEQDGLLLALGVDLGICGIHIRSQRPSLVLMCCLHKHQ
ncbi:hypothetical protein MG293_020634 [Ovis ammon polii]|uniref:Uncharacterized protein n=1 Tax=Ovis ammon polii TaxID=230172 RepID=A0AAD4TM21_OVIAM|nr:hypothetical protein MG293_020634 [Ovis ammon polii]